GGAGRAARNPGGDDRALPPAAGAAPAQAARPAPDAAGLASSGSGAAGGTAAPDRAVRGRGGVSAAPHRMALRVYYEDTDAGGVVYHANYLRFAERARTEYLRQRGFDHPTLLAAQGGQFVVTRCTIAYRAAARLDDLLTVE